MIGQNEFSQLIDCSDWSLSDMLFKYFEPHIRQGSVNNPYILPAQVANHSARFDLSCPLSELAI